MDTKLNTAGYDLYEISENEWVFDDKFGPIIAGSFKRVATHMAMVGFKLDEIEMAVVDMIKTDCNGSHFGMYRCFIYSFQKDFSGKKAS